MAATLHESARLTPETAARYRALVEDAAFVCVFGEGLDPAAFCSVPAASLMPGDPLADEWNVIVLTPRFGAALLARALAVTDPDGDRTFECAVTYRRDVVVRAARALVSRFSTVVPP